MLQRTDKANGRSCFLPIAPCASTSIFLGRSPYGGSTPEVLWMTKRARASRAWLDRQLNGQSSRRLITYSWNAERWHARNLALELVALGYPNVSWYRGGVEAWDVAGYPVVEKR